MATQTHFKKSVLKMYVEAVNGVCNSNKSAQQVAANGNSFGGLNNKILANVKADKGFKSNVWFNEKDLKEKGLTQKQGEDFGTPVFTTKLIDVEGTNKKETVLRYWTVWNEEQLEAIPV